MARARSASAIQSKIQMVLYGETFTGKSTLALQFAYMKNADGSPFKVLYIDPESGSVDDYIGELVENGVDPQNLYIVYSQSLEEIRQYLAKAKNREDYYVLDDDGNETDEVVLDADGKPFRPDAIVVDGATILNMTTKQGLIEFSKKRARVKANAAGLVGEEKLVKIEGASLEIRDYGTVNFKGQDLILDLNASGLHYIVTAREADEKMQIKNSKGEVETVSTGKKIPAGFKDMQYNCKTCVRMFRDDKDYEVVHAFIVKDRTGVHTAGEDIIDPSLLDYQAIIDRTAKNTNLVIKNNLHDAVKTEEHIYTKEFGVDEEPEAAKVAATEKPADIIQRINSMLSGKSPMLKKKAKDACAAAGLPTAFQKLTDVKELEEIEAVIKKELAE